MPQDKELEVSLVFLDWKDSKTFESIYDDYDDREKFILQLGNFHHGTIFKGILLVSEDDLADLEHAKKIGAMPCFYVLLSKTGV